MPERKQFRTENENELRFVMHGIVDHSGNNDSLANLLEHGVEVVKGFAEFHWVRAQALKDRSKSEEES